MSSAFVGHVRVILNTTVAKMGSGGVRTEKHGVDDHTTHLLALANCIPEAGFRGYVYDIILRQNIPGRGSGVPRRIPHKILVSFPDPAPLRGKEGLEL